MRKKLRYTLLGVIPHAKAIIQCITCLMCHPTQQYDNNVEYHFVTLF